MRPTELNKCCSKCGIEKPYSSKFFEVRGTSLRGTCRTCRNKRKRRPETHRARRSRYRAKNREKCRARTRASYYRNKKPSIKPSVVLLCIKCGDTGPFTRLKTICDSCYYEHKRAKDRHNSKKRFDNDPIYKIRKYTSNSIKRGLKRSGGSKLGESIMKYLPYSIDDLRTHIESKWEYWMNWSNYGSPKIGERMWQIDHVVPHSSFRYSSLNDPAFIECWSLNNLRPLEAFANMKKLSKAVNDV